MKYITIVNIVIRSIFIVLIFLCITTTEDYVYVPLLFTVGYFIGGILALYVVFVREKIVFRLPSYANMKYYLKDASPIFFTDVICTIKDKLNYILLGSWVGMRLCMIWALSL